MALEGLHQLALLHVPEFDGHVCAAGDKVGRVAGELAVPYPLEVPLEGLELRDLEFAVLHVCLEEADLLVGRAGGKILVVRGQLHFQNVVLVSSNELLVGLGHMLTIAAEEPLVIHDGHAFECAAHRDGAYAVVDFYLHHLSAVAEVPPFHHPYIIAGDDRPLVRVEGSAVDGLIVLETLDCRAGSEVKQAQVPVLAARVDEIFLLPKTSNCSDVPLEIPLVGA